MGSEEGSAVELRVGEEQQLTLGGFGATGYQWSAEVVGDAEVARVETAGVEKLTSDAIGASAGEAFTIRGERPGRALVRFSLRRPWEPMSEPPEQERSVEVKVT
jgi:predicted secreted protein